MIFLGILFVIVLFFFLMGTWRDRTPEQDYPESYLRELHDNILFQLRGKTAHKATLPFNDNKRLIIFDNLQKIEAEIKARREIVEKGLSSNAELGSLFKLKVQGLCNRVGVSEKEATDYLYADIYEKHRQYVKLGKSVNEAISLSIKEVTKCES